MATSVTPRTLKARATTFKDIADTAVQAAIDEAVRWMNEDAWGDGRFDDGVFYLASHILEELEAVNASTAGSAAGAIPAGPLTAESILDWSAKYGNVDGFNDELATTAWGRMYIARCRSVFADRRI